MAEIIVRAPWCLRHCHAPANSSALTFAGMRAGLQELIVESQYSFYSLAFYCLLFAVLSRWVCTPTPPFCGTFDLSGQFLIPSLSTPPAPPLASAKREKPSMGMGFKVPVPPNAQKKPTADTQIGQAVDSQIRQIFDSQKFDSQIKQSLMSFPNPPVLKNMFSHTSGKTYGNETAGSQGNGGGNGRVNGRGSGIGQNTGTSTGGRGAGELISQAHKLFYQFQAQSTTGALKLYREVRDNFPDNEFVRKGDAQFYVAGCLYNLNRFEEAIKEDEAFLSQYTNNSLCAYVLYFLGWAYFNVGNKTEAKQIWEEIVNKYPTDDLVYHAKLSLGNFEKEELSFQPIRGNQHAKNDQRDQKTRNGNRRH